MRFGPPLLLMGFIFWMGTGRASAEHTQSLLERLLLQVWPGLARHLSPETFDLLNAAVRKAGHFLGYALLGLLDARALRGAAPVDRRRGLAAWGAATFWAAVDEYHQSYFPSRGASVWDVCLDAAGAATGIFLYALWTRRTPRS